MESEGIDQVYEKVCRARGVVPDKVLLTSLQNQQAELCPPAEPHVSLLLHVLSTCEESLQHFTHLNIESEWLSPSAVGTIATYLTHQRHFTHLSIKNTVLPDTAVETILTALTASTAVDSPLVHLSLSNVGLSRRAAVSLAPLLRRPLGSLRCLDLSNNNANGAGVVAMTHAVRDRSDKEFDLDVSGNLVTVEMANAITHGVAAAVALVAGIILTNSAVSRPLPFHKVVSIATFCTSLFTLFASSCAYHSVFRHPRLHAVLRRADHLSIFLLIAGTYTPFIVEYTLDPPTAVGAFTLAAVWGSAIIGMTRSVLGIGSNRSRAFFALGTGWLGVMAIRTMNERMPQEAMVLVFAGGFAYSFGMIFYLLGKRVPMLHVIWHLAVIAGGSFHYSALLKFMVKGG